jgi:hypothetical protein
MIWKLRKTRNEYRNEAVWERFVSESQKSSNIWKNGTGTWGKWLKSWQKMNTRHKIDD